MKIFADIEKILKRDDRLWSKDEKKKLLKNKLVELVSNDDEKLLELLLKDKEAKGHFFKKIKDSTLFLKDKFLQFITMNEFLPDSFTAFENEIGLSDDKKLITQKEEISLIFPHKDCILEGGQTKEEGKREEIFYNTILAPDEVDRIKEPKVLVDWKKFDKDGGIKRLADFIFSTRQEVYGLTFTVDRKYGHGVNGYKPAVGEALKKELKPEDTFLDIGANIGFFSLIASRMCRRVYAIEPDKRNFGLLKKNIKANKSNIIANQHAVGKENEIQYLSPRGVHSSFARKYSVGYKVLVHKLDDLPIKARVVKISAMGSEADIFEGGKEFFKTNGDVIFLDFHPTLIQKLGTDPYEFLKKLYDDYVITVFNCHFYTSGQILTPGEVRRIVELHLDPKNHISVDLMLKRR